MVSLFVVNWTRLYSTFCTCARKNFLPALHPARLLHITSCTTHENAVTATVHSCVCVKLVLLNSEVAWFCRVWRVFLDQLRNRPVLHCESFVRALSRLSRPLFCRVIQQFNISYPNYSIDMESELEPSVGINYAPAIIGWTFRRSPLQLCVKNVEGRVA